jgi:hypothetical protein
MTIPTLYVGGFEELNIAEQQGSWAAGANLKNGHNCHEPSHFVAWKSIPGANYVLQRKQSSDFGWTDIYFGSNTIFTDNTPIGGTYQYRTIPFLNDVEGIPSPSLTFIVKPTITVIATKTCTDITLSWTAIGATQFQILRDDTEVGFTTATTWTGETLSGTFTFTVRGYIDTECYGEGTVVVSMLAPQAAGTLISSGCVGKNIVEVRANGTCGETSQVITSFQCDGCFNPQIGDVGAPSCSGNLIVQTAWSGTCDNNFTQRTVTDCGSVGCRNGECVTPATCADMVLSLSLNLNPEPNKHYINYDFGNRNVDAICVNAQTTWVNVAPNVQVYLDGVFVRAGALGTDNIARDVLLLPLAPATKWTGHITIKVEATGSGPSNGTPKLNSISWRNI